MHTKLYSSLCILLLLVSLFLLNACAGAQDWTYDKLPNNYIIIRKNSKDISLCKRKEPNSHVAKTIIGPYITQIAYNDSYIFAKQVNIPDNDNNSVDINTLTPSYYILAVKSEELQGPLNEKEFNDKCSELGIVKLPEWVKTSELAKSANKD